MNQLHYGDNLEGLRDKIADNSVDLVYLGPPFNSARNNNQLFRHSKRQDSSAQIMESGTPRRFPGINASNPLEAGSF